MPGPIKEWVYATAMPGFINEWVYLAVAAGVTNAFRNARSHQRMGVRRRKYPLSTMPGPINEWVYLAAAVGATTGVTSRSSYNVECWPDHLAAQTPHRQIYSYLLLSSSCNVYSIDLSSHPDECPIRLELSR